MKLKIIYLVLTAILFQGCTTETTSFKARVINETPYSIRLNLFGFNVNDINDRPFIGTINMDDINNIYEREIISDQNPAPFLSQMFDGANKVDLVFDNERIEIQDGRAGFDEDGGFRNHMLYLEVYSLENGDYNYYITEEHYENAVPCNGACE